MPEVTKNQLQQLKSITTVVADTGDIEAIKLYQPVDTTTNPSLVLKAAQLPQYKQLLEKSILSALNGENIQTNNVSKVIDEFSVALGKEILSIIPGKISTEVDARLSFNKEATIQKAQELIQLYQNKGIAKERILIKIAATWEGIQAAKELQKQGINCNITLIFNFHQALAAAQAEAYLISPFVGRILDWYKKAENKDAYPPHEDPGVLSVSNIYNYFRAYDLKTIVMGASFRNVDEIRHLAGCDYLTISPQLMSELENSVDVLNQALSEEKAKANLPDRIEAISESEFRWQLNSDPMATEKLAEGIRNFTIDQEKLEQLLLA